MWRWFDRIAHQYTWRHTAFTSHALNILNNDGKDLACTGQRIIQHWGKQQTERKHYILSHNLYTVNNKYIAWYQIWPSQDPQIQTQRQPIISLLTLFVLNFWVEWLNLPLALERARGGRGGIVTVLLIAGQGLLGCGLGMRCLLHCWRAHLNTASSKHKIKTSPLHRIKIQAYRY